MLLSGKVVVVTGGAGLIGKEFIKAIAEEGATAVIADINPNAAELAASELATAGMTGKVDWIGMDITSLESLQNSIASLKQKHGKIDALVNNAYPRNGNYGREFFKVEYKDFCENIGLHLGGYFLASQQFASFFKSQGFGNIVSISSIYGVMAPKFEIYQGTPMTMPVEYAAVKSALIHLTKYMAKYLKGTGIRVNAISPGGIINGQPEPFLRKYDAQCLSKGMLVPSDLRGTLLYLLSDMSHFLNGQNIVVDDGFSL